MPKFPYKEYRKGQKEVAEEVSKAVANEEILLLEAPTGFGKTAAVIDGLEGAGAEKVLWVVRTVNQIDPVLRELRRFEESFTYIYSAKRSCPVLQGEDISVEDFWINCRYLRSRGKCSFYENAQSSSVDFIHSVITGYGELSVTETSSVLARMEGLCPFFSLLKLAGHSKFVVATYPYLFKWDLFTHVLDIGDYSDLVIVIDEAHSILGIHSIYEYSIGLDVVERSLEELEMYTSEEELYKRIMELRDYLKQWVTRNSPGLYGLDRNIVMNIIGDADYIGNIAEVVREVMLEERMREQGPLGVIRVSSALTKLSIWANVLSMESSRIYMEVDMEGDHSFIATPMDPAEIALPILQSAKSAILMSGTLPPGNMVKDFLGLDRPTRIVDVELNYGPVMPADNRYVILGVDVSTRYSERGSFTYNIYSNYIRDIHTVLPGTKLAVYPSYDVMYSILPRLQGLNNMFVERKKTKLSEILDRLRNGDDLLINAVAGGKLVEGVEFVDNNGRSLLHTVIIVGIPYPQPNPYTQDYIELLSKRIGVRLARDYTYNIQAAIKVRQAIGRAVRSKDDRVVVFLLDHRFNQRKMRRLIKVRIDDITTYNKITFPEILSKARKHILGGED